MPADKAERCVVGKSLTVMTEELHVKYLFEAIADDNYDAFERFFYLYREKVVVRLFRLMRSQDVATELAQRFFIMVWSQRHKLTQINNTEAYINTILSRLALNYQRNHNKETELLLKQRLSTPAYSNDTQEKLDERLLSNEVDRVVKQLPLLQRKVYEYRIFSQMDYAGIGNELRITRQTAKAYYYQAVKFIRANMEAEFNL